MTNLREKSYENLTKFWKSGSTIVCGLGRPTVGLCWVELGWVEIFSFLVGWVGSWVRNISKNS